MNSKIKITLVSLTILTVFFAASPLAFCAGPNIVKSPDLQNQDRAFFQSSGLQPVSIGSIVALVIKIVLSLLGVIFLILIIYAGFMWMTAAGNEEKIKKAKDTMIAAIIGLAIVLAAYAITVFVLDKILGATGAGGGGSATDSTTRTQ